MNRPPPKQTNVVFRGRFVNRPYNIAPDNHGAPDTN